MFIQNVELFTSKNNKNSFQIYFLSEHQIFIYNKIIIDGEIQAVSQNKKLYNKVKFKLYIKFCTWKRRNKQFLNTQTRTLGLLNNFELDTKIQNLKCRNICKATRF